LPYNYITMSGNSFFEVETVAEDIKIKAEETLRGTTSSTKNYASDDVLMAISDVAFDKVKEIKNVVDNLTKLKNMSVEEFTFWKKWEEIRSLSREIIAFDNQAKARIWEPIDLTNEELTVKQIEELQPKMQLVRSPADEKLWTTLRYFCSTAEYNQAPGRFLKFLLVDDVTGKVLGLTSIASDVITISDRDKYIGWSSEDKLDNRMLKYSAIGTTIVPTQPFGSNFLGGKLTAAMVVSGAIRDAWEKQDYGEANSCKMVGMTTTSLYGRPSMYDGMKWWDGVGLSKGKIPIQPEVETYNLWHGWLKQHRSKEYNEAMTQKKGISGPVTGAKMRVLNMIFRECAIKQSHFVHGFERGVYYSCFYENTKDFLRRKISEKDLVIKPLFKNDVKAIVDWWKPAAIKRYKKLKVENRLNSEKLFYNELRSMTYEEAKIKYFKNVGK
jgi:Domain of unknown function (DUF4338)